MYNSKNYTEQGGERTVIGGALVFEVGATIEGFPGAANQADSTVETDSVLHHVWAGIEDDSSRWFHAADADNAERGLTFIIRFLPDIVPGMWILWNGEKQLITKIGEYDFKRRYMKLTTVSGKGVK